MTAAPKRTVRPLLGEQIRQRTPLGSKSGELVEPASGRLGVQEQVAEAEHGAAAAEAGRLGAGQHVGAHVIKHINACALFHEPVPAQVLCLGDQ